jgi:hypothetical protein
MGAQDGSPYGGGGGGGGGVDEQQQSPEREEKLVRVLHRILAEVEARLQQQAAAGSTTSGL